VELAETLENNEMALVHLVWRGETERLTGVSYKPELACGAFGSQGDSDELGRGLKKLLRRQS